MISTPFQLKNSRLTIKLYCFLLVFITCFLQNTQAQIALNLMNDTRANNRYCDPDGTVFNGCDGVTYTDDGGTGLYSSDLIDLEGTKKYGDHAHEPIFWTFCPSDATEERIRLTFSEFDIHASDKFYVYDGVCELANGDTNPNSGTPGQDDNFALEPDKYIEIGGTTPSSMTQISGTGTAAFGAGWIEASCGNVSGCITIGWNPNGDGNKGKGWEFTTSCTDREEIIFCTAVIYESETGQIDAYDGLTIGCGTSITLAVPTPYLDGCVKDRTQGKVTILSPPYMVEVRVDNRSLGFVGGNLADFPDMTVGVGKHTITYILHFVADGSNDPFGGQLIEKKRVSCTFTIYDAVDLTCKAEVNTSLGDDCAKELVASDVVGISSPAYPLTITIDGEDYTASCLTCRFNDSKNRRLTLEEGEYEYILRDKCNNACFGIIRLRDLQGPQCPIEVIGRLCTDSFEEDTPNAIDCNGIAEARYDAFQLGYCGAFTENEVKELQDVLGVVEPGSFTEVTPNKFVLTGSGSGPRIGNVSLLGNLMFESVTVRRWKVTDNKGNINNNCLQLFPNIRPDSLFMPDTNYIEVNCGDKITPKELYEIRDANGKRKYSKSTLAPWFKIQLSGQPDSVHYVLPNHPNSCSYVTAYTDQVIETIGNTKKVLRTWSWVDWCTQSLSRAGSFAQIIQVLDDTAPELIEGPELEIYSANQFECSGDITLKPSTWVDACGSIVSYRTELRSQLSNGDVGAILQDNTENGGIFRDVPLGCYYALYYAIDESGNMTRVYGTADDANKPISGNVHVAPLCVADDVKPQARCDDQTNIALSSDFDRIYATDFDEGSYDNCGIESLQISFTDVDSTYSDFVVIDCEDIEEERRAFLKVTDVNSNVNICWGTITIIQASNNDACDNIVGDDTGYSGVSGRVINVGSKPVSAVKMVADGPNLFVATESDVGGIYSFFLPKGGTYKILPEKDSDYLNGVSTYDLVLISRHVLGIRDFDSPYQHIAADLNKSGTITAFDMVLLRQLILRITEELNNNTSWRFVDAAYEFDADLRTTLHENFPEGIELDQLSREAQDLNFIGVKVGDVNGNVVPNQSFRENSKTRNNNTTMTLTTEDRVVKKGEFISVAFKSPQIEDLIGYQFTLDFDGLELIGITDGILNSANYNTLNNQYILTSWTAWDGEASAEDVLFTANFQVTTSGVLSDLLQVNSEIVRAEAYTTADEFIDVEMDFSPLPNQFELLQNVPNPFSEETVVGFTLPNEGVATLRVMTLYGEVLRVVTNRYPEGHNEVRFNAKDLDATGVLYYRLEFEGKAAVKKMIVVE